MSEGSSGARSWVPPRILAKSLRLIAGRYRTAGVLVCLETRVKDQLEDHLHELVCRGNLQLAIAQEAIASNWIASDKTYYNADKPELDPFTTLSSEGINRAN